MFALRFFLNKWICVVVRVSEFKQENVEFIKNYISYYLSTACVTYKK